MINGGFIQKRKHLQKNKRKYLKIRASKLKDSWRFFYGTIIKSYKTHKPTFVYFRIFEKQKLETMKIVISPAKSLNYESPLPISNYTEPAFLSKSETIQKNVKKEKTEAINGAYGYF